MGTARPPNRTQRIARQLQEIMEAHANANAASGWAKPIARHIAEVITDETRRPTDFVQLEGLIKLAGLLQKHAPPNTPNPDTLTHNSHTSRAVWNFHQANLEITFPAQGQLYWSLTTKNPNLDVPEILGSTNMRFLNATMTALIRRHQGNPS